MFSATEVVAGNYVVRQTPWTCDYLRWFAWGPGLACALVVELMVWGFVSVLSRESVFGYVDLDG